MLHIGTMQLEWFWNADVTWPAVRVPQETHRSAPGALPLELGVLVVGGLHGEAPPAALPFQEECVGGEDAVARAHIHKVARRGIRRQVAEVGVPGGRRVALPLPAAL